MNKRLLDSKVKRINKLAEPNPSKKEQNRPKKGDFSDKETGSFLRAKGYSSLAELLNI